MPVHPLEGTFQRVDRAQKHLGELHRHADMFRQNYPDSAIVKFDPDPPYYARAFQPLGAAEFPPIISILVGECVYYLRAALDYLVFELAKFDSKTVQKHSISF